MLKYAFPKKYQLNQSFKSTINAYLITFTDYYIFFRFYSGSSALWKVYFLEPEAIRIGIEVILCFFLSKSCEVLRFELPFKLLCWHRRNLSFWIKHERVRSNSPHSQGWVLPGIKFYVRIWSASPLRIFRTLVTNQESFL